MRLVSKERNCFPLFVKPLTSDPVATKIFSCGVLRAPPNSNLAIFWPGSVLNTGYKKEKKKKKKAITILYLWTSFNKKGNKTALKFLAKLRILQSIYREKSTMFLFSVANKSITF